MRFRLHQLPLAVALLCAALGSPLRAQVLPNALPTGWNVMSGSAAITRDGATLSILQRTPQAIVNFQTFDVGAGALVDIRQPGITSALLARTTGGDPSQILGQIKANGALWLINPAGILVGAGARIDVGSFVASTLKVSDGDFLAGRLTFTSDGTAGEVRNAGTIQAASGGSIYLVAPSVTNSGTIGAPHGEVLLAAGQNIQLMDTGTPGVSVAITGSQGDAKNLGRIVAEAGRIGLAAGLVGNSGRIDADSAVSEGGRIFLRASRDLETSAASDISASGRTGGRVELVAGGAAVIDGRVAATGRAGQGGYVDTSGHRSLDVVHAPVIGRGGEWHIDPFDIEIVESGAAGVGGSPNAITSNESSAHVGADTITAQLDAGVNVSITTGPWMGPSLGDITVSAPIVKTGAIDSTLTLNASNNIVINAPITSSQGALGLNLNSNFTGDYPDADHGVRLNANLDLRGGVLNVSEGLAGSGNGTLGILGGTTFLGAPTSAIQAAVVNVMPGGTLSVSRAGSALSGILNNQGTVSVGGTGTVLLDHGGSHTGVFDVGPTAGLSMSGGHSFTQGAGFGGGGKVEWSGVIQLGTTMLFSAGGNALVLHEVDLYSTDGGMLSTQGGAVLVDGQVALRGVGQWANAASVAVVGNGAISATDEGTRFTNDGTITTSGTQVQALRGAGGGAANFVNNGSLIKSGTSEQQYSGLASTAGSVIRSEAGSLQLVGAQLDGQIQAASGANVSLDGVSLGSNVRFAGAGSLGWRNTITLLGSVDIGVEAPEISLGASTVLRGLGHALTTRNLVHADGAQVLLLDQTKWNNLGTFRVGVGTAAALLAQGSGAFDNQAGGTVRVGQGATLVANFDATHPNGGLIVLEAGGQLGSGGADIHNNGRIEGTGALAMGGAGGGTLFNNGVLAPGTSATTGTLRVSGNFTQGSLGVLEVKLAGLGTGQFDLLDVEGSARLGGRLDIRALDGFAPMNAAQADFIVARGSASGGSFDQIVLPAASSPGSVAALSVSFPAQGTTVARVTASVAPSLGACTANPSIAGCSTVLPTLAACTTTPSLAGCFVVLPTLTMCVVSPSLQGCSAVLPTASAQAVKPVQQATNEVIKTVAAMQATPVSSQPPVFKDASTGGGTESKSDTSGKDASVTKAEASSEPVRKMYCN